VQLIAKQNIARGIRLGLDELEPSVFRYAVQQLPTAGQKDRADDELIFIDQSVLGELRYDGAATEDYHIFPGLAFHVLDLARIEFVNDAGIFPRRVLEVLGRNHFARFV